MAAREHARFVRAGAGPGSPRDRARRAHVRRRGRRRLPRRHARADDSRARFAPRQRRARGGARPASTSARGATIPSLRDGARLGASRGRRGQRRDEARRAATARASRAAPSRPSGPRAPTSSCRRSIRCCSRWPRRTRPPCRARCSRRRDQQRWASALQEAMRPPLASALHIERTQAPARRDRALPARGLRVGVWTVNDPAEARELASSRRRVDHHRPSRRDAARPRSVG